MVAKVCLFILFVCNWSDKFMSWWAPRGSQVNPLECVSLAKTVVVKVLLFCILQKLQGCPVRVIWWLLQQAGLQKRLGKIYVLELGLAKAKPLLCTKKNSWMAQLALPCPTQMECLYRADGTLSSLKPKVRLKFWYHFWLKFNRNKNTLW